MEEGNFRCEPNVSLRPARRDDVRLEGRAEEHEQLPRRPARHRVRGRAPDEASSTRAAASPPRRAAGATRRRRPSASARRSRRTTTATSRSRTCRRSPSRASGSRSCARGCRSCRTPGARASSREYGLSRYEANLLTESRARADYFEAARAGAGGDDAMRGRARLVANWLLGDLSAPAERPTWTSSRGLEGDAGAARIAAGRAGRGGHDHRHGGEGGVRGDVRDGQRRRQRSSRARPRAASKTTAS